MFNKRDITEIEAIWKDIRAKRVEDSGYKQYRLGWLYRVSGFDRVIQTGDNLIRHLRYNPVHDDVYNEISAIFRKMVDDNLEFCDAMDDGSFFIRKQSLSLRDGCDTVKSGESSHDKYRYEALSELLPSKNSCKPSLKKLIECSGRPSISAYVSNKFIFKMYITMCIASTIGVIAFILTTLITNDISWCCSALELLVLAFVSGAMIAREVYASKLAAYCEDFSKAILDDNDKSTIYSRLTIEHSDISDEDENSHRRQNTGSLHSLSFLTPKELNPVNSEACEHSDLSLCGGIIEV